MGRETYAPDRTGLSFRAKQRRKQQKEVTRFVSAKQIQHRGRRYLVLSMDEVELMRKQGERDRLTMVEGRWCVEI